MSSSLRSRSRAHLVRGKRSWRFVALRPRPGQAVVLCEREGSPLTALLREQEIPVTEYETSSLQFYIRPGFVLKLFRWVLRYGASDGHLIAFIEYSKARIVLCLEKSDQRNSLLRVSYALPDVQIISMQHTRFFESPHLHNTWGNPWNVRIIVWGAQVVRQSEAQGRNPRLLLPAGSLRLGLYRAEKSVVQKSIPILVCVKAKDLDGKGGSQAGFEAGRRSQSTAEMLRYLGRYANHRGIKLYFPIDSREAEDVAVRYLDIYREITKASCSYFPIPGEQVSANGASDPSVYDLLRAARVVVGVNSSLLWEAVASALPVVSASFGAAEYSRFPKVSPWVLVSPTYEEFELALNEAASAEHDTLEKIRANFSEYLLNDEARPCHQVVVRLVRAGLKSESLDYVADGSNFRERLFPRGHEKLDSDLIV